jgi:transcriptional regulator with XRE-family HTH domain
MSVAQGLVISRTARGLRQGDLPGYTQTMVSMIERGERKLAKEAAPLIADKLDHPALYFELQREVTGGVGPAWLNGPNVDLHRSAVREKTEEECMEFLDALRKFGTSKPPQCETEQERKKRWDHLLQGLDVVEAVYMYIAIQCEEYGFSLKALSKAHYDKLRGKRYVVS